MARLAGVDERWVTGTVEDALSVVGLVPQGAGERVDDLSAFAVFVVRRVGVVDDRQHDRAAALHAAGQEGEGEHSVEITVELDPVGVERRNGLLPKSDELTVRELIRDAQGLFAGSATRKRIP